MTAHPTPRTLLLLAFVAFISLGLPDGLLGISWPSMRQEFRLPLDALGLLATVTTAGTSGGAVVVLAGGVVYKHADNGWSAIRLAQKTRAVMSGGTRSVAAVGRHIVALDQDVKGEAVKLASASSAG